MTTRFRIVGKGRAGRSFNAALRHSGWWALPMMGRGADLSRAGLDADVVIVAVPDDAIAEVARALDPHDAAVLHLSGSRTLDVLKPHERRGSVHPLMSLPDPLIGAARLRAGCTFAVTGDPMARIVVDTLGGTAVEVDDRDRAAYHAAASIAANHLVALCHQVERVAATAGLGLGAYAQLMRTTLENVERIGCEAALTGPAARGDWHTITNHLAALPAEDADLYLAAAKVAASLGGQHWPHDLP